VIFCNFAIYCDEQSVIEIVEWTLLKERLTEALAHLTAAEYDLIAKLFFEGVSERELAKEYRTSQSSINRMKQKIFLKLKQHILSEE
jgi:RNA polymerase sigma factor (sigma-70 family)